MSRFTIAALLFVAGGVLLIVGLGLNWTTVANADGTASLSVSGFNYNSHDHLVTIVLAILLILCAVGVYGARRWGRILGLFVAVATCLWAVLVFFAVRSPSDAAGADLSSIGLQISVGFGAVLLLIGAGLALLGAVLSFRGPRLAEVAATQP